MSRRVADDEAASYQPPKLPKTQAERDSAKRLIVVLEGAALETVKVGRSFQLLNSSDHMTMIKKNKRDPINLRPDITHQCLLMLLDSPLNKAGMLQIFIHTRKNVLIEVHPQTRIPRVFSRFCGLMVQLLHEMSISAKGSRQKLLKVIKNPITDHLPTGCVKIATSYACEKLVRPRQFLETQCDTTRPICFIVGAVAHGKLDVAWKDDEVAISQYAMSAAGVCAKLTDAFEEVWGVH
eukprot:m.358677 g.358677  ORF g.358677 m.358677 type:complete len:237 (-) comp18227_c0_seq1:229-939(-)